MPAINITDLNNAQLDVNTIAGVANSSTLTVTDRLGNTKNTLVGMNAAVLASAAAVQGSIGYLPPVAYAAGISLTLAAQTVSYTGQTYAPLLSALPFTTSGTFETAKFRLIQGVAGADLGASSGASLVGIDGITLDQQVKNRLNRVVASIAGLKALDKTKYSQAVTAGYLTPSDGGSGSYYFDATDTTSADNGGSIIVAGDGARWKLLAGSTQNPRQCGAVGGGDVGASLQKMFTQGSGWTIPAGLYKFAGGLIADYSDSAFPAIGYSSIRHNIRGDSPANSLLEFTGIGTAISATGSSTVFGGQGIYGFDSLGGFSLYPTARARSENGIVLARKAYTLLENIAIDFFGTGLKLDSCLTSLIRNVHSRNNNYGLILDDTSNFTRPNSLTFDRMTLLSNVYAGAVCNVAGASVKFVGLNVEYNGRQGVVGDGGFLANISGNNGLSSLSFDSPYFEGNAGDGDLIIDNVTGLPITIVINGGCFNRVSNTRFTTSNIVVGSSGGGKVKLILIGVGFLSAGTYVPSATRPFIKYDANCEVIDIGCTYSEAVSMPAQLSAATTQAGRSDSTATVTTNPQGVTTTRNAAGIYTVQRLGGFSSTADGYVATAICNFTGGSRKVERITQAASSFQVVITDNTGALVDGDFSWALTRVKA